MHYRCAHFVRETEVTHLFWVPDIFVCNGWQSALIPTIYKGEYEGINEFYNDIKTVLVIHDLDEYSTASKSDLLKVGIERPPNLTGTTINL